VLQEKNNCLISEQVRSQKLISQLRRKLSRECKRSSKLEELRQTLTGHVRDMETAVDREKEQVGGWDVMVLIFVADIKKCWCSNFVDDVRLLQLITQTFIIINYNNNYDDIYSAVIYSASHMREFTVVPVGESQSVPGGCQLVGQAANLTF